MFRQSAGATSAAVRVMVVVTVADGRHAIAASCEAAAGQAQQGRIDHRPTTAVVRSVDRPSRRVASHGPPRPTQSPAAASRQLWLIGTRPSHIFTCISTGTQRTPGRCDIGLQTVCLYSSCRALIRASCSSVYTHTINPKCGLTKAVRLQSWPTKISRTNSTKS